MIFAPFTIADVSIILKDSHERRNRDGHGRGHAYTKHVGIPNSGLMDRLHHESNSPKRGESKGIALNTSFNLFADQVKAVHEALNSADLASTINAFYRAPADARMDFAKTFELSFTVEIRVATGGGVITRSDKYLYLAVEKQATAYRNMHIITAYPKFADGTLGSEIPRA